MINWLTHRTRVRYEKEFDGVQDVFELQVRDGLAKPWTTHRLEEGQKEKEKERRRHFDQTSNLVPAAQPEQRLRVRSRPLA